MRLLPGLAAAALLAAPAALHAQSAQMAYYVVYKYTQIGSAWASPEGQGVPGKAKSFRSVGFLVFPLVVGVDGLPLADEARDVVVVRAPPGSGSGAVCEYLPFPGMSFRFNRAAPSSNCLTVGSSFRCAFQPGAEYSPGPHGAGVFVQGARAGIGEIVKKGPKLNLAKSMEGALAASGEVPGAPSAASLSEIKLAYDNKTTPLVNAAGPFPNTTANLRAAAAAAAANYKKAVGPNDMAALIGPYRVHASGRSGGASYHARVDMQADGLGGGWQSAAAMGGGAYGSAISYVAASGGALTLASQGPDAASTLTGAVNTACDVFAAAEADAANDREGLAIGVRKTLARANASLRGTYIGAGVRQAHGGAPRAVRVQQVYNGDGTGFMSYVHDGRESFGAIAYEMASDGTFAMTFTSPGGAVESASGALSPGGVFLSTVRIEGSPDIAGLVRASSGCANATLKGEYTMALLGYGPSGAATTTRHSMFFNGDGTGTATAASGAAAPFTYKVNDNGEFTLTLDHGPFGGSMVMAGAVSGDGQAFCLADDQPAEGYQGFGVGLARIAARDGLPRLGGTGTGDQ